MMPAKVESIERSLRTCTATGDTAADAGTSERRFAAHPQPARVHKWTRRSAFRLYRPEAAEAAFQEEPTPDLNPKQVTW